MTTPAHFSHSQFHSWLRCGLQYKLQRIDGITEKPSWALVGGSAFHNAVEFMLAEPWSDPVDVWDSQFAREIAKRVDETGIPAGEWRASGRSTKAYPNAEDGAWWAEEGQVMLTKWNIWWEAAQNEFEILKVDNKEAIEIALPGYFAGYEMKAYADVVLVSRAGEVVVVDWKSGARTPDSDEQLGVYAALMEQAGLPRPSYGMYYMARKAELTPASPLARYTKAYFDRLYDPFLRARAAKIFPANVGMACKSCSVASACWAVGGADAEYDDNMTTSNEGQLL